jgi:adenylate cyclase class 2
MSRSSWETEIKIALADRAQGLRHLRAAGFRVSKRRVFEANTVFDTPDFSLRNRAELLRVREAGKVYTVTYKGPPEAAVHKSREELEVQVSLPAGARLILDRLGYRPVFRYEKYRTELKASAGGGVATVDETPIGVFMELEGSPRWIDRTAAAMGYTTRDYITASYGRLYREWCARRGTAPTDMVF